MTNNILALIILGITFTTLFARNISKTMLFGGIAVIGAILVFVSVSSAQIGDFGPATGVLAFCGTLLAFVAFNAIKAYRAKGK